MSWVTELARPDIVALAAYEHAAWLPQLGRMHANELPWRHTSDATLAELYRYPEPQPRALVERLASLYEVAADCLLVTRGSDDAIDLLVRTFCRAGEDAILVCPPTFGMYAVAAGIQGAQVFDVPLRARSGFVLDEAALLERCTAAVKLVFLCSPNNPTGNLMSEAGVLRVARQLAGRALLVVDEAYIEFAGGGESCVAADADAATCGAAHAFEGACPRGGSLRLSHCGGGGYSAAAQGALAVRHLSIDGRVRARLTCGRESCGAAWAHRGHSSRARAPRARIGTPWLSRARLAERGKLPVS